MRQTPRILRKRYASAARKPRRDKRHKKYRLQQTTVLEVIESALEEVTAALQRYAQVPGS